MKQKVTLIFCLIISVASLSVLAQSYQGPAVGSITGGVLVTTDDFSAPIRTGEEKISGPKNIIEPIEEPYFLDYGYDLPKMNYVEDKSVSNNPLEGGSQTLLLHSFAGIPMTNSIPPDPIIAAGPNHIIACVNSEFTIFDKEGNEINNINADSWYNSVLPNPGAFDPQVIYDHFSGRWVILYDNQNDAAQSAYFLISVSDDDDPNGFWYNYAIPADQNGSTPVPNWGDYPQIGFDDKAIYINSRAFTFGGGVYQYNKIRIINKTELYNANGGAVSWTDFWDITNPGGSTRVDVIEPCHMYTISNEYYLLYASFSGGNTVSLYKISDPIGSPVLTGVNIAVPSYTQTPLANQLGGSTILIESGGARVRTQPVFRDGILYAIHSIRNPNFTTNSSIQYYQIDVNSNLLVDNGALGAQGYYYIYPAITVDKDHNMAMTYSRSADTEYIGSYFTTKLATDPPGTLEGSRVLQEGKGNYVVDYGSGRNRWGDYLGVFLDPSNEYNVWMLSEYAAATNTWGTWIGEVRMIPYPGVHAYSETPSIDLKTIEVGFQSPTYSVKLRNIGADPMIITDIPSSFNQYLMTSTITFPVTLNSYDSLQIDFVFAPTDTGLFQINYPITSNDPEFTGFDLSARGFTINSVLDNILYGYSGASNDGRLVAIDTSNATSSLIGLSFEDNLTSVALNPVTKNLYGISSDEVNTIFYRIDAAHGGAFELLSLPISGLEGIAFDTLGTLYGASGAGLIYFIDLENQIFTVQSDAHIGINNITIDHKTNKMYACQPNAFGQPKDKIYEINPLTGDTLLIGRTGFNTKTYNAMAFDGTTVMYISTGLSGAINELIRFDLTTLNAESVGFTGYKNINGLSFLPGIPSDINDNPKSSLPEEFSLNQNYPNPFNPSTTIEYALPTDARVRIVIYNLLGEVVSFVNDSEQKAGYHSFVWNSKDNSGNNLSSGIYFYELKADGINGQQFTQLRKMVLLK